MGLALRDREGRQCVDCGIISKPGSQQQDVCTYKPFLQNMAVWFLADGNGFNTGNVRYPLVHLIVMRRCP